MRSWKSLSVNLATLCARLSVTGAMLVTNGIAARRMTQEQFGLWVILLALNTLTNGFDLGFQFTLGNRLAALGAKGQAGEEERRETFLSVILLQIAILIFDSILVLLLFPYVPWAQWFKIRDARLVSEVIHLMPAIAIIMIATLPVGLMWTVFFAYREIKLASFLSAFSNLTQVIIFAAAAHMCSFTTVVYIYFSSNVALGAILTLYVFIRRRWSLAPPPVSRMVVIIRSLTRVSIHSFFHTIASIISTILGPVVSGFVSGLVVAGDFTLVQKLFSFLVTAHLSLMAPLGPAITAESHAGHWNVVRGRLRRWTFKVWPLFFAAGGSVVWFAHPVLIRLWAGHRLADYPLAGVFLIWACISGFTNTFSVFLNSLGLMKLQAAVSFGMIIPLVVLPVLLGRWMGAEGIALALVIGALPAAIVFPIYTRRALRLHLIRV